MTKTDYSGWEALAAYAWPTQYPEGHSRAAAQLYWSALRAMLQTHQPTRVFHTVGSWAVHPEAEC